VAVSTPSACMRHLANLFLLLRCSYGLDLFLLSIDEGISGYRDDSLETVKRNEETYGIPLVVVRQVNLQSAPHNRKQHPCPAISCCGPHQL
jgi:tRNA(Ile)-lysidine synthase TilS/MesJ